MNHPIARDLAPAAPRAQAGTARWIIPVYIGALTLAELAGLGLGALTGAIMHAALIILWQVHSVLSDRPAYRRFLPVLSLISLLRVLSLAVPLRSIPQVYWNALVGIPLLVAALLVVRLLKLPDQAIGLGMRAPLFQGMIAFTGLPLGLLAYLLLRPSPQSGTIPELALAGLVFLIFVGFLEELLFRGLILHVADEVLGGTGLLVSSVLFTVMYLGSFSLGYTLLMAASGVGWGWATRRTGSLWGAALAHGVMILGLGFYWPLFFG